MTKRLLVTIFFTSFYLFSIGQVANFTHDFDPSSSNSCAPISISFTNTSTGANSYSWRIDGLPFSSSTSPQRSFAEGGSYNVCLDASDGTTTDQSCQVLNISEPANIQITNTPTAGCTPYASTINITSNEIIATATIDYGDGVIDVISPNTSNFSSNHTYTQEGIYSVTASVIDNNGCSSTTSSSNVFTIRNIKDLGFSVGRSSCQIPLTATFSNTSANAGNYRFDWDFGDGTTLDNSINASHDYNISGAFDVTLTATDLLTGCVDSYIIADAINSQSVTSITTTEVDNGTCSSKAINFSLDNLPSNSTISWDFGDGMMSGVPTTSHIYTTAGCFTPTAEVTTASGCIFTVSHGSCITSIGPNDPSYTLSGDLETCNPTAGTAIQHNSNSINATAWTWDFGDGNTSTQENPNYTYTGYGTYTPTLTTTYTDGCMETYSDGSQTVTIEDPTLTISVDTARGCIPFDVNFSILGSNDPIASIDWNFGAGATPATITDNAPAVSFAVVGDYDISATVTTTSGCSYIVTSVGLIEVGDIPNVDFTIDTLASCVDSPIEFTDLSDATVDEWEWNFGDGTSTEQNPTHQYSEPDSFQVTLKVWYNGCPAELVDTNYIQIGEPKADFTWDYDCTNLNTINFTDLSTGADSIWWDYGDGSAMEDLANPSHVYPGEGSYIVTQYTKNHTTDCIDDKTITINLVNPIADFDIRDTTFCVNDVITITNLSTNIYNISWTISNALEGGDFQVINAGSGGADAQIRFLQTQDYIDFTLNYSIDPACPANRSITYNNTVRADFIFPTFTTDVSGCLPAQIMVDHTLADLSTRPFGDPTVVYTWQLDSEHGDTIITGPNPVFNVDKTGVYEINLIMTNGAGCNSGIATPVNVNIDTTNISFDWSMINCDTKEIEFVNTSEGITANAYEWIFGDGGTSNAATTSHQYAVNGDYDVTFIVHTTNGCSDTLIQTIQVYDPTADFAGDNLMKSCPNPALITNFTNNSIGAATYEWNFGDGGSSTLMNPAHAFSSIDSFDITLIATSVNGCRDTITRTDYIKVGGPYAELEYSTIASCTGSDIQFIVKGDGVAEYTWDFGDGNALTSTPTATNDTLTFAYAVPGKYQPILIAEDVSGCRIPYVGADSIEIFDLTSDFTADNVVMCSNNLMDVAFTSQISNPTAIDSIRWFFPGSDTPTALGTTVSGVSYTTTNQYDVTMIAYSIVCTDTLVKTAYIEVFDPPAFTAPADVSICNGSSIQFDITDGAGLIWSWDNSGSLTCDDCPNPIANPTVTTTYTITGTSPGGCSITGTVTVTVDDPNVAFITTPNVSLCVGRIIPINIPSSASNLVWTSAVQTLLCTNCNNQEVTVNGSGTVDVAYDYLSCRIIETLVIDAWDPATIDESANAQSICPGDAVDLDRPSYPGTIEWRADDINSAPLSGTSFNPTVDTRYYISVSYYGCTVIDSFDITIDQPSIAVSPDLTICVGESTTLNANGGPSYTYTWVSSETTSTLSCISCASPDVTPLSSATFTVTADNGNGCTATEDINITVNDITSDELPDSLFVCIGAIETISLPAVVSNVNWSSTLALSQATGLTTDVTASATADVQVTYVRDFCTITETVVIYVWDPATVDAGPDVIICQGEEVTLPTNYPGTSVWREGSMSATPIVGDKVYPTIPTRYYLEVINHGCSAIDSIDIDIDLPTVTASADVTICLGESTPLTVTGDPSINAYNWDNSITGLSCYPCADPIATPITTTAFVVIASNTNGCTARDTVVVTVNDSIPNYLPDTMDVCTGDILPFALTGVTNVNWVTTLPITTSNGGLNADVTAVDTNFVDVTYDWNTCTYTERIVFHPWDPISVDAGMDQLVCQGQQVVLPISSFGTTTWREGSPTATPLASNIVNPTTPTTYFMEVSYNGCVGTDDIFIDIDLPTITTSGDVTICLGESTPLTVSGAAGNTYEWTPSFGLDDPTSATPSANPTSDVDYVVTGTNTNGCTVSEMLTVTVNNPQSDILGDTIKVCLNVQEQINIVPNSGTTNIQWSSNITGAALTCTSNCNNPMFTAADTGIITLTYEYQSCMFTETVYIDTWDPNSIDAGMDELICVGDTVSLNTTGYNGIVEWREGSLSSPVLFVTDVHPEDDTWYYLSVTRYGCTGVDSLQIRLNKPTLEVDQPDRICVGTTIPLFVRGVSDPNMIFEWDGSQPGLSCLSCDDPDATPPFTSTYTVTGTNSFGCSVSENVTVTVDQDTIDLMPDTIYACINSTYDILLDIINNPGVDTNQIFWATNIPIDCQCYHPQLSVDQSGPMVLNYQYNACFKREDVYVVVWDPNSVDAGSDQTICAGEEVQLNSNYPGQVNWYFDSMSSTSLTGPSDVPTQSGRYYLRVDNSSCFGIDSMDVTVLPNADISGGQYEICEGDSIQVDVVGSADSILFNNANSISDPSSFSPWASPTITTIYTVVGRNNGCAMDTATIEVVVNENPVVDMRLPAQFIEGDEIRLQADVNATDNLTYIWTPGGMIDCTSCQLPLFTPTESTLVSLTVINDDSGCMAVDTATIIQKFICGENSIGMANAFSPNNDGLNDHIKPVSLNQITAFKVFNRWGELVFRSDASGLGWDGRYKGKALKRGVYVFVAEGLCRFDGTLLMAKGDFILMR